MITEYKISLGTDNPQEVKGILIALLPRGSNNSGVGNPSRYLSHLIIKNHKIGVKEAFEKAYENYYAWKQAYYPTVEIYQQSGKDVLRLVSNDYRIDITLEYSGDAVRWYQIEVSSDSLETMKNVSEKIGNINLESIIEEENKEEEDLYEMNNSY